MKLNYFFVILVVLPFLSRTQISIEDKNVIRIELAKQVNQLRASKGLPALLFSDTLRKAAEFHSKYMADNDILSHDQKAAKYATPTKRVKAQGGKEFESIGENVLYTKPQEFPLKKNDLSRIASEMFLSWKNSPPHYQNMIEAEYVYGDFGFEVNLKKKIVFATQVFGKRGVQVANQLSKNEFGITKATEDCDKAFNNLHNVILNMGNGLQIEGHEVILYYNNEKFFKTIFTNPKDGIAIDLVSRDQLACEIPNKLDVSPIHDGILLKPIYRDELLKNNRAEGDFRMITKVGDIPKNLDPSKYSASTIIIKNGQACKYVYPALVPHQPYALRPIEPFLKDEPKINLTSEGIILSQIVEYDFKTNSIQTVKNPEIEDIFAHIQSVQINSFSSVEGDSVHNAELHNSRAEYIKNHIKKTFELNDKVFTINAKENWELMNFQLSYHDLDPWTKLQHDSIKNLLLQKDSTIPWDSLLFNQRRAQAIINYQGRYNKDEAFESLAGFNLRTAIALNNPALTNKALYEMYKIKHDADVWILLEPQTVEFMIKHTQTVTNYSAMLTFAYSWDPYSVTRYLHSYLPRFYKLDKQAQINLLQLYALLGMELLNEWDVASEKLARVIHPSKIEPLIVKDIKIELLFNLHLTFIQYYGQVNDDKNIKKSFEFISNYFKSHTLEPKDDVDLCLFYNSWSMYFMTIDHLMPKFEKKTINQEGLFVLAETLNFTNYDHESEKFVQVHEAASNSDRFRWCDMVDDSFQILRNYKLKRLYCETCDK